MSSSPMKERTRAMAQKKKITHSPSRLSTPMFSLKIFFARYILPALCHEPLLPTQVKAYVGGKYLAEPKPDGCQAPPVFPVSQPACLPGFRP